MARRRPRGRDVNGIMVLDKPGGMSSNDAVQKAKQLFAARKVGHTGSLDPLATGVLPLCFGEATRFSRYLLESDKKYTTRVIFGVSTDSGDADGKVMRERPVGRLTRAAVDKALDAYRGEIQQVPSMFSAVKHQGQPLYKLARKGIEVERKARSVTVYSIEIREFAGDGLDLDIHCSKGTYVRTIVHELGESLGCGAHVTALRRTMAGPFGESDLVTFEMLGRSGEDIGEGADRKPLEAWLQPASSAVRQWPEVTLTGDAAYYLRQGQPVIVPHAPTEGWVRLAQAPSPETSEGNGARFLGVGEILDDGRVAPRRLIPAN
ncbi:MAG: tRNA pseudouridine(55) synthase TruB [Gammaproteobacteria bacterium]|nr:tRNA pseudouridine(55) synthase TruB [Gammaproteobacteria bacterium]